MLGVLLLLSLLLPHIWSTDSVPRGKAALGGELFAKGALGSESEERLLLELEATSKNMWFLLLLLRHRKVYRLTHSPTNQSFKCLFHLTTPKDVQKTTTKRRKTCAQRFQKSDWLSEHKHPRPLYHTTKDALQACQRRHTVHLTL